MNFDEAVEYCQRKMMYSKFFGTNDLAVSPYQLESDGRKRTALIRKLTEDGYLKEDCGALVIQDATSSYIDSQEFNIVSKWTMGKSTYWYPHRRIAIGALLLSTLNVLEINWLYNQRSAFQFYVGAPPYDIANWNKKMFQFSVSDHADYKRAVKASDALPGCVYFTNEGLKLHVQDLMIHENMKDLLPKNLLFGLGKLGLLGEYNVEQVQDIFRTFDPLVGDNTVYFSNKMDEWKNDIENNEMRIADKMEQLSRNLKFLIALRSNMSKYGGWSKFLSDYQMLIAAEVRKKSNFKVYPE